MSECTKKVMQSMKKKTNEWEDEISNESKVWTIN